MTNENQLIFWCWYYLFFSTCSVCIRICNNVDNIQGEWVYSFGILLLETFTGKGPRSNVFRRLTLREWVFKAHPTAILDVIDNNLLNDHPSNGQLQDRTTIHTFLMSIIELRLLCTRYSSKERISMTNVAAWLWKIKMKYSSNLSN